MVATPVLRSVGGHFHPVGPLTIANMVPNPNLELADGSLNLLNYSTTNLTFKQSTAVTPRYGNYCGKVTYTSTTQMPVVLQSFNVNEATDYTASMWVTIPTALSTGLSIIAICYARTVQPLAMCWEEQF